MKRVPPGLRLQRAMNEVKLLDTQIHVLLQQLSKLRAERQIHLGRMRVAEASMRREALNFNRKEIS